MLTKTNRNVERVHDFVMIFDEVGDSVLIKSLDKVSLSTRWKRTIPGAADNSINGKGQRESHVSSHLVHASRCKWFLETEEGFPHTTTDRS